MEKDACIAAPLALAPAILRPPGPGDIGWVISRHGALYAAEYGLDARFEALVAHVAANFLERHDPAREACWIAERDGARLGSVFLVADTSGAARRGSGCCWSSRTRAAAASAGAWCARRSASPAPAAIPASCSGPTTC